MTEEEKYDEMFPDDKSTGALGINTMLSDEPVPDILKSKPKRIKKEYYVDEAEDIYKSIEALMPAITIAIGKGNAQGVYNLHKFILEKYKKVFL